MGRPREDDDDSRFLVSQPVNAQDERDHPSSAGPANQFFVCSQCPARFRSKQALWEHFETHGPRLPDVPWPQR